ncbi:MAG: bifunctional 2-keto-4-hydroxyglutarate aldolase/2-keto-3-deoxy-6-phosphogluconate aldolase [Clostridia bacterium]|nr:bifunctional 2-keto-4-hydroxyglutarate aldolase/2-keto-3-deoxy-6-phosphogluconate aldolase [Clostridia bacterium]
MNRRDIISEIGKSGAVVVVRGDSVEQGVKTAEACYKGGIKIIEVTFTLPRADEVIRILSDKYKDSDMIVGAGSVLDAETARAAILAGARFIVSPAFSESTVRLCNRYGIAVIPGVSTPTEAVAAMELGVDVIKLFPGEIHRPAGLKAIKAPFPNLSVMPTGGVNADNASEWLAAGAYALGAGSSVTKGAAKGDYAAVEADAKSFISAIKRCRESK